MKLGRLERGHTVTSLKKEDQAETQQRGQRGAAEGVCARRLYNQNHVMVRLIWCCCVNGLKGGGITEGESR